MKIRIVILAIVILLNQTAQSKLRHLLNFTVQTAVPPIVKCLSGNQIAYETDNTITVFDVHKKVVTQSIVTQTKPEMQVFSQSGQILYNSGNGSISQIASKENDISVKKDLYNLGETLPSTVAKEIIALPQVDLANQNMKVHFFDFKTKEQSSVEWQRNPKNISSGSSPITYSENGDFYILTGCQYDGQYGFVSLYKGSYKQQKVTKIHKGFSGTCDFTPQNSKWSLQTYEDFVNGDRYHLIAFPPYKDEPKIVSNALILERQGVTSEVIHFYAQRQIGSYIVNDQMLYTADNILCRVLEHDVQNHEHDHIETDFAYQPLFSFVSRSQKYLSTIYQKSISQKVGVLYEINSTSQQLTQIYQIQQDSSNITQVKIYKDLYLVQLLDNKSTIISQILGQVNKFQIPQVQHVCVSDDFLYAVRQINQNLQLSVFQIAEGELRSLRNQSLTISVKIMQCLDQQTIIMIPVEKNQTIQTWKYHNTTESLTLSAQIAYPAWINNFSLSWVSNIIIFTDEISQNSTFYDYELRSLTQNFNLAPNAVYSITRFLNGGLLLAVGDDLSHFVSYQYYTVQNSTIQYKGTFPYIDGVPANRQKTFIFPKTDFIHIGLDFAAGGQSITFSLNNSPLKSIGYFFSPNSNQCSDFQQVLFRQNFNNGQTQIFGLVYSQTPQLQYYLINGNKLDKKGEVLLPRFRFTDLKVKISQSNNQIIISGIAQNSSLYTEVRDVNKLDIVLDSAYFPEASQISGVDFVNNRLFSVSSIKQTAEIKVQTSSQFQVPILKSYEEITVFSVCPDCGYVATSGILANQTLDTNIHLDDLINKNQKYSEIPCGCSPSAVALSKDGNIVSYYCADTIGIVNKTQFPYTIKNFTKPYPSLTKIQFLDQNRLICYINHTIKFLIIQDQLQESVQKVENFVINLASQDLYAVNYKLNIFAVASNSFTVWLYDFEYNLKGTFVVNATSEIVSLDFNSNDELYVSTANGQIVALTQQECGDFQTQVGGYCVCKPLFSYDQESCRCNFQLSGNQCVCKEGFFQQNNGCSQCSFICQTCKQSGAFSCQKFSVWFYLVIALIVLITGAIVLVTAMKLKKPKKKYSLLTGKRTDYSGTEPHMSQKIQNQ